MNLFPHLTNYYVRHARIYNISRWTFLFGRKRLLKEISLAYPDPSNILEIGCGTGYNLLNLAKAYPNASITGIDLSKEMLEVCNHQIQQNKLSIEIINEPYSKDRFENKFDLILCSYSLSMMGIHTTEILEAAYHDLKQGGFFTAVDFHRSKFDFFTRHMKKNHIQMNGTLLEHLETFFPNHKSKVLNAYAGLWQYFTFTGLKS
ncbi:MAG: class I SAM-dependent methyltransferase [Saprospiraceae bacterium]|nr:class I SAM-dependent methyltransferase [Candidatus Vicinibacter affinis]MBK7695328.1 class I SAM-dependent methyltransferase [Candidatus Vicinibacter affinis]MBK8644324.1 class I SAM-dependent methyltransferase [Candidatus Vicinibacter affinis]HQX45108.1 class I SAM-dependent methyltransferase [Saprospiraceae bacterium]